MDLWSTVKLTSQHTESVLKGQRTLVNKRSSARASVDNINKAHAHQLTLSKKWHAINIILSFGLCTVCAFSISDLFLNQWAWTPQIFGGIPQIGCGMFIAKKNREKNFTENFQKFFLEIFFWKFFLEIFILEFLFWKFFLEIFFC
jgi:hypothetical protein